MFCNVSQGLTFFSSVLTFSPLLYLPECREILWFSYGSAAAAAGYGGYYGGGGYGEILTFVILPNAERFARYVFW